MELKNRFTPTGIDTLDNHIDTLTDIDWQQIQNRQIIELWRMASCRGDTVLPDGHGQE